MTQGAISRRAGLADRHGKTKLAQEGLYRRRKTTALIRRSLPGASMDAVKTGGG